MGIKTSLRNRCRHAALICLETLAVIAVLVMIAGGVLVWRLSNGSVDITFARNYIEEALYDSVNGFRVSFTQAQIGWPEFDDTLVLNIKNVNITRQSKKILDIDQATLGVSLPSLFLGEVSPVSVILTGPSLQMIRRSSTNFEIGLQQQFTQDLIYGPPTREEFESDVDENILMRIVQILSRPESEVDDRSPLSDLDVLEIRKAQMVIEDYVRGMTWFLEPINLAFNREEEGLVIMADVALPGGRDRVSEVRADLTYFTEAQNFRANIHVQDFNPRILASKLPSLAWMGQHEVILNGNLTAHINRDMAVQKIDVNMSAHQGALMLDGIYDDPFAFERFYIDAAYMAPDGKVTIREMSLTAQDVTFDISSDITYEENMGAAHISFGIPALPQEKIAPLWPDALRGEGAEIWLTQKLSEGVFQDITVDFDLALQKQDETWETDIRNIKAGFGIEGMTIDYRAPLSPVTNAAGAGRFAEDTLTIDVSEGMIDGIAIDQGTVAIDKVIAGGGTAAINVALNGPLENVFRYIQPEPIGMDEEKLGLKVDAVKGQAALDVQVSFPTIRDLLAEQVKVNVDGNLSDVVLPDVIESMDLSGGALALEVDDGTVELKGSGKLEGRPVKFNWLQYVGPEGKPFSSRIVADIDADKALREKFGLLLDDWIAGTFPVNVTYTEFGNGQADAQVKADLTPGSLFVEPFDYTKKPGQSGEAECRIRFRNGKVTEVNNLAVNTESLDVSGMRLVFRQEGSETILHRGQIPHFILLESDLEMDFEIAPSGRLKLKATGPFMDAQPFLGEENGADKQQNYDGPPVIASVEVDRLRTHPARIIENARIYLDMDRAGEVQQFEMDAVAGNGDIYFRLKPNERGVLSAHLEADDAGAALQAFGVYENVSGGTITLYGEARPDEDPRLISGKMEMRDFKVVRAPVLAQLLNAISLVGIPELLANDGLSFARLESDFSWKLSRFGDIYEIDDGRTSGSSIGLTFEGTVNKQTGRIDLKGTIVPISMFNEMISAIPLIGDILGGGKDSAVIAATYTVKGPIKQPEVMVNPLAALAPGFLRRIFFE